MFLEQSFANIWHSFNFIVDFIVTVGDSVLSFLVLVSLYLSTLSSHCIELMQLIDLVRHDVVG